jgi:hypothetical protein
MNGAEPKLAGVSIEGRNPRAYSIKPIQARLSAFSADAERDPVGSQ